MDKMCRAFECCSCFSQSEAFRYSHSATSLLPALPPRQPIACVAFDLYSYFLPAHVPPSWKGLRLRASAPA